MWRAVLLNPAENTGREFLEAVHWHRIAERLEQGVHDVLKDVELDLVRHLISLLWVVLVSLHYVLIVPYKKKKKKRQSRLTWHHKIYNLINGHDYYIKEINLIPFHTLDGLVCLHSKCHKVVIKILKQHLKLLVNEIYFHFLDLIVTFFNAV